MSVSRRGFLRGIGAAFVAAPAIVRAASLMAVSPIPENQIMFKGIPLVFDNHVNSVYYLSEDAPFQFTGFYTLVKIDDLASVQ